MKVFCGGRAAGKTYFAANYVKNHSGTAFLAFNNAEKRRVKETYGLSDEQVYSLEEIRKCEIGRYKKRFVIDNLEMVLSQLLDEVDIEFGTVNGLHMEEKT